MVFSAYLHRSGQSVARVWEGFLSRFFLSRFVGCGLRGLAAAGLIALLAPVCLADSNNPITLDTSETIFAVLTAMNTCGYNVNLNISDAQRLEHPGRGGEEPQELGGRADQHECDVRVVPGASREGSCA